MSVFIVEPELRALSDDPEALKIAAEINAELQENLKSGVGVAPGGPFSHKGFVFAMFGSAD